MNDSEMIPADSAAVMRSEAQALRRDEVRARANAAAPPRYSPWFHLLFPSLCGLGIVLAGLLALRDLRLWQLACVPVAFVVVNLGEWVIHRDLLHKRTPGFTLLYDRHTPMHHVVFVTDDMAIRSWRELRLVLIPPFGIFGVLFAALPFLGGFMLVGQRNLGLLFACVMIAYAVTYEWLHLSYHLPPDSFVGRNRLVRWLRRHHAMHHDPSLMQRWNFNVSFPIADWLAGTIHPATRARRQRAAGAWQPGSTSRPSGSTR